MKKYINFDISFCNSYSGKMIEVSQGSVVTHVRYGGKHAKVLLQVFTVLR